MCSVNKQERDILKRFNCRQKDAFSKVYKSFYNDLFYFANKIFANTLLSAEDAIQDIFLKFLENDKQFKSLDSLKGYIYVALRNKLLNEIEHNKVVKTYENKNFVEDEDCFLSAIIETETMGLLYQSISSLPIECGKVMQLCLKGLSNKEVASVLGISVNTVYAHKQRAKHILRKKMSEEFTLK